MPSPICLFAFSNFEMRFRHAIARGGGDRSRHFSIYADLGFLKDFQLLYNRWFFSGPRRQLSEFSLLRSSISFQKAQMDEARRRHSGQDGAATEQQKQQQQQRVAQFGICKKSNELINGT